MTDRPAPLTLATARAAFEEFEALVSRQDQPFKRGEHPPVDLARLKAFHCEQVAVALAGCDPDTSALLRQTVLVTFPRGLDASAGPHRCDVTGLSVHSAARASLLVWHGGRRFAEVPIRVHPQATQWLHRVVVYCQLPYVTQVERFPERLKLCRHLPAAAPPRSFAADFASPPGPCPLLLPPQ